MSYGNGMTGGYTYNNQLELSSIQYGSSSGSILNLSYGYGLRTNNSQIQSIVDGLVSARSTSYAYDELGRLQTAQTMDQTSANTWKLKFTYDRYGNRLSEIPVGGTARMPMNEVSVDAATNQIVINGTRPYDAAGNMTSDGSHAYSYDAESRLTNVDGAANTFAYDGSGFRVNKNGTIYIAAGGKVLAEYAAGAAATAPNVEYIYAGGQRVAAVAGGTTTFNYNDQLSTRVNADSTGTITRTYGHYPFGETWYETGTPNKWKFTTYERDADSEGGLDNANARFDSTRIGRFMSLDPLSGRSGDPQSLNHYSYVANDPVNLRDPSGRTIIGGGVPGLATVCLVDSIGNCHPFGSGMCLEDGQLALSCSGEFADECPECGLFFSEHGVTLFVNGNAFDLNSDGEDASGDDGSVPDTSGDGGGQPSEEGGEPSGGSKSKDPQRKCTEDEKGKQKPDACVHTDPLNIELIVAPPGHFTFEPYRARVDLEEGTTYGVGACFRAFRTRRSVGCAYVCSYIYKDETDFTVGYAIWSANSSAITKACGPGVICPASLIVEKNIPGAIESVPIISCRRGF